jgi:ubiquinone/menaquinone biosynthesis C-methylase UbiE/DNA-binding transcriptional ArsR family regulator
MEATKILKALADETRLRIVHVLLGREFSVKEIVRLFGMIQSRISRHLKILTESGILNSRRDGLWMFYTVSPEGAELLENLKAVTGAEPKLARDKARAARFLKDRKKDTSQFFDRVASNWEAMKKDILGDFSLSGFIMDKVRPCATASDLGCGSGDLLKTLASKADSVIGVDSSSRMLEEAKKRFQKKNSLSVRIGELEHLPLRDGECDLAVLNMVLHHLPSPYEALLEAHRVLSRKGQLVIADFEKHDRELLRKKYGDRWLGFERREMESWLLTAGFEIVSEEEHGLLKGIQAFVILAEKKG